MSIIETLRQKIEEADAIVVGAGAGLSTAAGFEYGGEYFLSHFKDIHDKYGYTDMYSAGFHPFPSPEEKWGYWSRMIYLNRYEKGATPLYLALHSLLKDKNYFVLTTNVDHQFQLAGFDKKRLFYTQGDYGLFQCSKACHPKTYDNKELIYLMVHQQKEGKIPTTLIPVCPVCGEEMDTNLRKDNLFVEDEGWQEASKRYSDFIRENRNKKILFLELGVGFNTPGIIKYPFMRMTNTFKDAFYICINKGEAYLPDELKNKSLAIDGDIAKIVAEFSNYAIE